MESKNKQRIGIYGENVVKHVKSISTTWIRHVSRMRDERLPKSNTQHPDVQS